MFGSGPPRNARWHQAREARDRGEALLLLDHGNTLLYSRPCIQQEQRKSPKDQRQKFAYFLLSRDPPDKAQAITGNYLVDAYPTEDREKPAVGFKLSAAGGDRFHQLTSTNRPNPGRGSSFYRHLAILLDDRMEAAPSLNSPIRADGVITGNFTRQEVDTLVRVLRAGALPAALKPIPVSEIAVEPKGK